MNFDIQQLHESCGIISAHLTDPLSLLLNKILNLSDNDPNAVGFYYETEIQGTRAINVLLFNIYDNHVVSWLKLGCTLNKLLKSIYVSRITFHPLITTTNASNTSSLLSRITLGHINGNLHNKILDRFKILVIETMTNNAKILPDKSTVYKIIFQRWLNLSNENITTGYNLVNSVLNNFTGDSIQASDALIPCMLLKKSNTIVSGIQVSDIDEHVIQEIRHELSILAGVFLNLLTSSLSFYHTVQQKIINGNTFDATLIDNLMNAEEQLVTSVVTSIQGGLLSNVTLNDYIKELVKQRMALGNYKPLTMSIHPSTNVQITQKELMCSFQQPPLNNINSLRDLGATLSHIAEEFNKDRPLTINLSGIITAYNLAVQNTTLPIITVPDTNYKHTISRNATVTMAGDSSAAQLIIPNHDIAIPIYDANLTIFSESQLKAVLLYIDSLRSPDGHSDTRFAQIQNEIVQELAKRRLAN